jgi:Bifunctional DNA primase/polymerase, N-terminal
MVSRIMSSTVIAISLANRGFRVFPCSAKKRPTIPRVELDDGTVWPSGVYGASNNDEVIERHFRNFWGPLVAYATGRPSDIDVLDFDEKHGGLETFDAIRHRLPRTFIYRTGGNGGLHVQFRHHPSMRIIPQRGLSLKGAEVKSTGGYAIAWWMHGSQVIDESAPAPWPEWLLDLTKRPEPGPLRQRPYRRPDMPLRGVRSIVGLIAAAPQGERNSILFWGACRLAELVTGGILDRGFAEDLLVEAAAHAGLALAEARATIRSGLRHG